MSKHKRLYLQDLRRGIRYDFSHFGYNGVFCGHMTTAFTGTFMYHSCIDGVNFAWFDISEIWNSEDGKPRYGPEQIQCPFSWDGITHITQYGT